MRRMAGRGAPLQMVRAAAPAHSGLYEGVVRHTRRQVEGLSPAENVFSYRVMMAYLDLGEVGPSPARCPLHWPPGRFGVTIWPGPVPKKGGYATLPSFCRESNFSVLFPFCCRGFS